MKTLPATYRDPQHVAADVEARIDGLFSRCPTLCGFSIQGRDTLPQDLAQTQIPDADLFVTEIGVFPRLGAEQFADIFDEITATLSGLVAEQPNAYEVLRGRTFARAMH